MKKQTNKALYFQTSVKLERAMAKRSVDGSNTFAELH